MCNWRFKYNAKRRDTWLQFRGHLNTSQCKTSIGAPRKAFYNSASTSEFLTLEQQHLSTVVTHVQVSLA